MSFYRATEPDVAAFHRDGYLIVRGLLTPEETDLVNRIARSDLALEQETRRRADARGGFATLALRNALGDDVYSAITRSRRIVDTMETLLGGEVYHYHHKMNMKQPYEGGAWEWHQDYGYWYNNGCLFPDMASCMIALDRATRENGCLQVLRGSHRMGRIDHGKSGDQTGADLERVQEAEKRLERVYVELDPGDAVLFHCNLLHCSDQNRSPNPRWVLICCYNARSNDPYRPGPHPNYAPLARCDDSEIMAAGRRQAGQ